ncbi:BA75_02561T0 [Komagataella pastoris]|uniref:BA75_02561T0 n=1 Tax=Komagataella pastoris TaxID=4922 RepID=A0A1B2JD18_PICPA|nr:BA75_02561T0 [Komagataella pastoris]
MYEEEVFELPQDILDGLVSNVVEANEDTKSESPKEPQEEFELEITDDILNRLVNDTVGLLEQQGQKDENKPSPEDAERDDMIQSDQDDKDQTQKQAKESSHSDKAEPEPPSEAITEDRNNESNEYGKLLEDTEALLQQFESSKSEVQADNHESTRPVQETSDIESQQQNPKVKTSNSQQTEHEIESEVNFRDMLRLAEQHVQIDQLLSGSSEEISHEILEQLASATAESIQNQQKQLAKEFGVPKQQQLQREFLNRQKQQQKKVEVSSDENLQEALANMVQSVVNNVVENSKNEKADASKTDLDTTTSSKMKASESHDLDQTQLNQILENAVAMAISNPNNLLDNAPANQETKQNKVSDETVAITSQEALDAAKARLSKLPIKPMKRTEEKNKSSDLSTNSGAGVFNPSPLPSTGNSSLLEAIRNASHSAMKQIQEYRKTGSTIPLSKDVQVGSASSDMLLNNQAATVNDAVAKKAASDKAQDASKKRGLSIAQTLAITRDQMVRKVSTEPQNISNLYSSLSRNSSLYLQRQQMLNSMKTKSLESNKSEPTGSLPLLSATISAEVSRITGMSSDAIRNIFNTVNNAVDMIAPSLNRKSLEKANMDLKEKIRMDNRERKKRWRELNVDKNRDNDLRARVLKRASVLFPSADEEEKKKKWVQEEFTKRKQKRLERERENKPIYSAFETKKEANSKDNYKPSSELTSTTDTVLKQFNNLGIPDDPKFTTNFTELYKTLQNSTSSVYSSKNSLINTATAAIVAYASVNQEPALKHENVDVTSKLGSVINKIVSALLDSTPQEAAVKEITGLPAGAMSSFKIRKDSPNQNSSTADAIKRPSKVPDAELTLLIKNKNSNATNSNNTQMIGALRNLNLNFTTEKRKMDDVPISMDDSTPGKKLRTEDRKSFSAPWTFNTLKLPQYKKPEAGKPVYSPAPPRLGQPNTISDRETSKSMSFGGINLRKPGAFRKPKTTTQ